MTQQSQKKDKEKASRSTKKIVQTARFSGIIELMKTIKTENKYSTFTRNVQLKIDEFFAEKIIPENDSVRLLDEIAEEIKEPLERVLFLTEIIRIKTRSRNDCLQTNDNMLYS